MKSSLHWNITLSCGVVHVCSLHFFFFFVYLLFFMHVCCLVWLSSYLVSAVIVSYWKPTFGDSTMQQEENNVLKSQNEDLSAKLRQSEEILSRVKEELARYRASSGRDPCINLEKEQSLNKKLKVSPFLLGKQFRFKKKKKKRNKQTRRLT